MSLASTMPIPPTRKFLVVDRLHAHSIWDLMQHIARVLIERGHEVHFCRWDDGKGGVPPDVPFGVHVHDIQVGAKRRPWHVISQWRRFLPDFARLLREIQPDIVHTNFTVPGALARRVAKREGVPWVISTQHELYGSMSPHLRLLTRVTERYADRIVYVSETVARSFRRPASIWDGEPPSPRHLVIPNGIDVEAFAEARGADADRVGGRILCTGRLVRVKGYDVLLKALPRLLSQVPTAHVRLAGSGPDEARLRELAAKLEIADRVEFLGWIDRPRLHEELRRCAVTVIPSDGTQEGFGLVAAEAMAAGVPIVASRIPVFEEVLGRDGECARLFTCGSATDLGEKITAIFSDRPSAAERSGCGLERVRLKFSAGQMLEKYLKVYDQSIVDPMNDGAACVSSERITT